MRGDFGMFEMEEAVARIFDLRERTSTGLLEHGWDDFKMFDLPRGSVQLHDMRPEFGEWVGFLHLLCGGFLKPASALSKRYFVPTEAFWGRLREKGKT